MARLPLNKLELIWERDIAAGMRPPSKSKPYPLLILTAPGGVYKTRLTWLDHAPTAEERLAARRDAQRRDRRGY